MKTLRIEQEFDWIKLISSQTTSGSMHSIFYFLQRVIMYRRD